MPTYVAADGAALHYLDEGPAGGIPLLFIHGWQGSAKLWGPVADRLSSRHRTLAVDLRGFGGSSPAPGPYSVEQLTDDLSAFVASLDLDPLVVIGHSMGGAVAQRFAIDRPDAVEGLILISPIPATGLALSVRLQAMFRGTVGNISETNAWLTSLTFRDPPLPITALLREAAMTPTADASLENFESWRTLEFGAEAATIETPTLIIGGEHDRPMTPDFLRDRVASEIAGSRLEIVPEAAHFAQLEAPAVMADRIERFVNEL